MKTPALKASIKSFTNALKKLAVEDKSVAMELTSSFPEIRECGINSRTLKPLVNDFFEKNGKLKKECRRMIMRETKEAGLGKNATWYEYLKELIESKK